MNRASTPPHRPAPDAVDIDIDTIARRLDGSRPKRLDLAKPHRAATALCLRSDRGGVEALFIRRTIRDDDRWSGQMALPGGRVEDADAHVRAAAERETREEVALDLPRQGRFLGTLDELQAWARGRPIPLVVTPHVYALSGPIEVHPDPSEVAAHVWIPIDPLLRGDYDDQLEWEHGGGGVMLPCYQVGEYTIWGLTYRMINNFFEVVHADRR